MIPKLLLLSTALSSTLVGLGEAKKTLRGVPDEKASLYPSKGSFSCITHPDIGLPVNKLNDNYCDCPDGSDEPGTSACASIPASSLGIPGFYCKNKGYRSLYIPLNRVDDGVCDCCDGSDEPKGTCKDTCKQQGEVWKKEYKAWEKTVAKGVAERGKLVDRAKGKRLQMEMDQLSLERELERSKEKLVGLEEEVRKAEEEDKLRVVKGGELSVPLQLLKDKSADVREALRKTIFERNVLKMRVERLEELLKALHTGYNPNFNDEAVKAAIKSWEEYTEQQAAVEPVEGAEDADRLTEADKEEEELYNELNTPNPTAEDLGKLWELTSYFPEPVQKTLNNLLFSARNFLVDNGILAGHQSNSSKGDSPRLTAAKDALNNEKGVKSGIESKISQLEKDRTASYGPDDVFLAIKGECLSKDEAGYKYTMCFSGSATQKSLKDHSEVNLGVWTGISVLSPTKIAESRKKTLGIWGELLEDRRVDGTGEIRLKYENGQQCWNGPKRSVNVEMTCAEKNELREVRETQKCVYEYVIGSPVVCRQEKKAEGKKGVKDEL